LHLGAAYQFRTGDLGRDSGYPGTGTGGFNDNVDLVRFRTRISERDAVPTNGGSVFTGSVYGDGTRIIDTGNIISPHAQTIGGELLYNMGSLWIQSEYTGAVVSDARYPATAAGNLVSRGTAYFWGSYVMVGYFLTGEQRGYDRRFGRYDRVIPNENFFAVLGEDDRFNAGWGAWEVIVRFSHVDLNDKGIDGGILNEYVAGLNWYLNPGMKVQFQYGLADRTNLPGAAVPGSVQFLGVRAHWDF
jgi:phosphate-selective porin OprO/OprP